MYRASSSRYDLMQYNRCGKSGLKLPAISLGLWHNFGSVDDFKNGENIVKTAFDKGINNFYKSWLSYVAGALWRMGVEKIFIIKP